MDNYDLMFCDTCVGGSTVAARLAAVRRGLQAALERWVRLTVPRARTLVVACNTASVLWRSCPAVQQLAQTSGLHVASMVDFLERLLQADPSPVAGRRVCLMGTRFTVAQPVYSDLLMQAGAREVVRLDATRTEGVIARLQHLTESGRREIAAEIGGTVRACDVVVLACTLFPLVAGLIREVNPSCALLDPGSGVADILPSSSGGNGENRLTVALTGAVLTPAALAQNAAALFPGWQIDGLVSL